MAGNEAEWVEDWVDLYPGGHHDGTGYYADSLGMTYRVLLGGAYSWVEYESATFRRGGASPEDARWGFRCVVVP